LVCAGCKKYGCKQHISSPSDLCLFFQSFLSLYARREAKEKGNKTIFYFFLELVRGVHQNKNAACAHWPEKRIIENVEGGYARLGRKVSEH